MVGRALRNSVTTAFLESTNHAKPPRRQILTFPNRVLIYSRLNKLRSVGVMRPSQSWKISQKFTITYPILVITLLNRENLENRKFREKIVYSELSFDLRIFLTNFLYDIPHIFNAKIQCKNLINSTFTQSCRVSTGNIDFTVHFRNSLCPKSLHRSPKSSYKIDLRVCTD